MSVMNESFSEMPLAVLVIPVVLVITFTEFISWNISRSRQRKKNFFSERYLVIFSKAFFPSNLTQHQAYILFLNIKCQKVKRKQKGWTHPRFGNNKWMSRNFPRKTDSILTQCNFNSTYLYLYAFTPISQ